MGRPSFKESKTAIVIIAWNSDHFIGACVESALSLRCRTLDVWVVDNGSSDSTPDILSALAKDGSGDEANDKDYGCPGGFDGERIETMEDLFLLTVFQIYTKLLLPNEG